MALFCFYLYINVYNTAHSFCNLFLCFCFWTLFLLIHFNCYVVFHCRNILNVFVHFPLYNHLFHFFLTFTYNAVCISKSRYQSEIIRSQSSKSFNFANYCQSAFQSGCLAYTLTRKYESTFGFRFWPSPRNDFCQSHEYDTSHLHFPK